MARGLPTPDKQHCAVFDRYRNIWSVSLYRKEKPGRGHELEGLDLYDTLHLIVSAFILHDVPD